MNNNYLNRDTAAEIFIEHLIRRAYEGAIEDTISMLSNGPPGRKPSSGRVQLSEWYNSLDETSQKNIHEIVRDAADAAVFGCLVLLDNLTGGYPFPEKLSEFALYIQAYDDDNSYKVDSPQLRVRINPADRVGHELHDLFRLLLDSRKG